MKWCTKVNDSDDFQFRIGNCWWWRAHFYTYQAEIRHWFFNNFFIIINHKEDNVTLKKLRNESKFLSSYLFRLYFFTCVSWDQTSSALIENKSGKCRTHLDIKQRTKLTSNSCGPDFIDLRLSMCLFLALDFIELYSKWFNHHVVIASDEFN